MLVEFYRGASLVIYMFEHGLDCLKKRLQDALVLVLLQHLSLMSCRIVRSLHLRRPHS